MGQNPSPGSLQQLPSVTWLYGRRVRYLLLGPSPQLPANAFRDNINLCHLMFYGVCFTLVCCSQISLSALLPCSVVRLSPQDWLRPPANTMLYTCSVEVQRYRGNILFKSTEAHSLSWYVFSCSCSADPGRPAKRKERKVWKSRSHFGKLFGSIFGKKYWSELLIW